MFIFLLWLIKEGERGLSSLCYLCTGYIYGEASSVRNSVNSVGDDCSTNGSYKGYNKIEASIFFLCASPLKFVSVSLFLTLKGTAKSVTVMLSSLFFLYLFFPSSSFPLSHDVNLTRLYLSCHFIDLYFWS